MEDFELTTEEKAFIRKLKSATKNIPPRLWLFCSESGLHVMRKGDDGEQVYTNFQGVDQDYVVATATIYCSCGAW